MYVMSETLFPLQIDKLDSAVETITSLTSPAQILFSNDTFQFLNVCVVIAQRTMERLEIRLKLTISRVKSVLILPELTVSTTSFHDMQSICLIYLLFVGLSP